MSEQRPKPMSVAEAVRFVEEEWWELKEPSFEDVTTMAAIQIMANLAESFASIASTLQALAKVRGAI